MSTPGKRTFRRRKGLPTWRTVRYADDFVVLVHGNHDDAHALREEITHVFAACRDRWRYQDGGVRHRRWNCGHVPDRARLLPAPTWLTPVGGRPEKHPRRAIVDAIRYVAVRTAIRTAPRPGARTSRSTTARTSGPPRSVIPTARATALTSRLLPPSACANQP
jgi:hypothetical protein